ncbi:MAG: flagellin [Methylotenera sp.]
MSSVINTNIASLNTQRNLNASQSSLHTSIQRLSSGLRINSSKDDAAGLAIASRMDSQIRGQAVAIRNSNDGISLAQTAEGALASVGDSLQRIRELAVQSSNATNSNSDRAALNSEAQQLMSEINRVANQTSFNSVNLLDGTFSSKDFQVGANAGETISIASIADSHASALGSTSIATVNSATLPAGITLTAGSTAAVSGVAGLLTIKDGGGNAVEIFPAGTDLAKAYTGTERIGQVKDAINAKSSLTGVSAGIDATDGHLVLTSSHDITVASSSTPAVLGIGASTGTAAQTKGFASLDISSAAGATLAMKFMDSALAAVNTSRADLGAIQNRFSAVVSNLQSSSENLTAAKSRIMDTDFAAETANLTRGQILQQAGTAMLAQANSLPNGVLALLRG